MITLFRLEVDVPRTKTAAATTLVLTSQGQSIASVTCDMRKEDKRDLSFLEIKLRDVNSRILDAIPDPSFADVPMRFYMTEPGHEQPTLVWEGIVTRLAPNFPDGDLELVGHDKSIKMRKQAKVRAFKKMSPVDAAKKIASEYGLTSDIDIGDLSLQTRAFMMSFPGFGKESFSDWDFIKAQLLSVGLTPHVHKGKMYVRQTAVEVYPVTFRPGDGRFISLKASINHVKGPGDNGNVDSTVAFENSGTAKALKGTSAKIAEKQQGGSAKTPRSMLGGATGSATEGGADNAAPYANDVVKRQGRKDDATLTLNPTPGVFLHHLVDIAGCARKIDGKWEVMGVKHVLVPESEETTTLLLARGVSKGSADQMGGVAFDYKGIKTT